MLGCVITTGGRLTRDYHQHDGNVRYFYGQCVVECAIIETLNRCGDDHRIFNAQSSIMR